MVRRRAARTGAATSAGTSAVGQAGRAASSSHAPSSGTTRPSSNAAATTTTSPPADSGPRLKAAPLPKLARPGVRVTKQVDEESGGRSLLVQLEYPEWQEARPRDGIAGHAVPQHRFVSRFEQTVEPPGESGWQLLVVTAPPFDAVAVKVPDDPLLDDPATNAATAGKGDAAADGDDDDDDDDGDGDETKNLHLWDPVSKVYTVQIVYRPTVEEAEAASARLERLLADEVQQQLDGAPE